MVLPRAKGRAADRTDRVLLVLQLLPQLLRQQAGLSADKGLVEPVVVLLRLQGGLLQRPKPGLLDLELGLVLENLLDAPLDPCFAHKCLSAFTRLGVVVFQSDHLGVNVRIDSLFLGDVCQQRLFLGKLCLGTAFLRTELLRR